MVISVEQITTADDKSQETSTVGDEGDKESAVSERVDQQPVEVDLVGQESAKGDLGNQQSVGAVGNQETNPVDDLHDLGTKNTCSESKYQSVVHLLNVGRGGGERRGSIE